MGKVISYNKSCSRTDMTYGQAKLAAAIRAKDAPVIQAAIKDLIAKGKHRTIQGVFNPRRGRRPLGPTATKILV